MVSPQSVPRRFLAAPLGGAFLAASSWKSIMRSRASRSSAAHVSPSNRTRLPGIAFGRPFVMVMKKLRQLLAQAFVPLGLVSAHHRLLEQDLLNLLRQLAPQVQRGEAQGRYEAFAALVCAHEGIKSAFDRRGQLRGPANVGPQNPQ